MNAIKFEADGEGDPEARKRLLDAAKALADATSKMVEAAKVSSVYRTCSLSVSSYRVSKLSDWALELSTSFYYCNTNLKRGLADILHYDCNIHIVKSTCVPLTSPFARSGLTSPPIRTLRIFIFTANSDADGWGF